MHPEPGPSRAKGLPEKEASAAILLEPSLFYNPPYDRPLEDEFAWHLVKYLNPVTALGYQVKVETACANVWVDFVVEHGGRRFGFECGELEGEGEGETQERLRDALVVGSGGVDVLYRFRGADLVHRLHDCLLLVSRWDPDLFSTRGQLNLGTLASPEGQAHRPLRSETAARLTYGAREDRYDGEAFTWPEDEAGETLVVRRLGRDNPAAWLRDYDRALAQYGISDDRLGEQWAKTA